MSSRRTRSKAPQPTPGWPEVALCLFFYTLMVLGIPMILPTSLSMVWLAPLTGIGGIIVYVGLLRFTGVRDPRIWRDRSHYGTVVRQWALDHGEAAPDEVEIDQLRAASRLETGVTIAQQAGLFAGIGTGVALLAYSETLAVLVFGGCMLAVGHLVKEWLMAADRSEFESEGP